MKKLILITLLFIGLNSFCQDWPINEKNGKISFSKVLTFEDKTSDDLYNQVKLWLSTKYRNSNVVTRLDDKEGGVLLVKAELPVTIKSFGARPGGLVGYDFKIQIRDNRIKFEIFNLTHYNNDASFQFGSGGDLINDNPECGKFKLPLKNWREIKEQTFNYFTELSAYFELSLFEDDYSNDDW
jgi:hypothetical protein